MLRPRLAERFGWSLAGNFEGEFSSKPLGNKGPFGL